MPYPNEHACRLRDPDDFQEDSFVRVSRETDDGDSYDVIRGELVSDGSTQDQSHRYPIDTWTESAARRHCREHDGTKFEPATGDNGQESARMISVDQNRLASPKYFQHMAGQLWAVQSPEVLHELAEIAQRSGSLEAVQRARGERAEQTFSVQVRNGVAIVPIMGPIMPRANLFSMVSGATSLDMLALDLQKMVDSTEIKAILLNIDSPGGTVSGTDEMAGVIKDIAAKKRVVAYVGGVAASAAYWLASAASEIVTTRTGQLGSIGVVATVSKQVQPDGSGIQNFEIVSSNASDKRPDPATSEGASLVRSTLDEVEKLFIDSVATNRGVSRDTVIKDFGKGNVMVGGSAVRRNMADRVGTFEGVLSELEAYNPQSVASPSAALESHQEEQMADPNTPAQDNPGTPAPNTPTQNAADSADVVDYCYHAGVPQLAGPLIREQASMETVKARVSDVGEMQTMAEQMVSQNMLDKATADQLLDNALKLNKSADALSRDLLSASFQSQTADDAVITRSTPETGATADNSERFLAEAFKPFTSNARS